MGTSVVDSAGEPPDDFLRTAERHASIRVPVTSRSEGVSQLLTRLTGHEFDSVSVAAVCEGEMLVGLVTIERLLAAPPDAVVGTVMDADPPTVSPDTHQEHGPYPRNLDTGVDYAAVGSVAARRAS
jgi:magnesium transporter